ncbi:MAG: hypothetical protein RR306_06820 [Clostridia bacterium]
MVAVVALASLAVLAFYNIKASFGNVFEMPNESSRIVEDFSPPVKWNGEKVTKKVAFENTGNVKLVLRFQYAESFTKADGTLLPNTSAGLDVVDKVWTSPNGTVSSAELQTSWTKGADGWYYYKFVMKPADKVFIMDNIKAKTSPFSAEYQNAKYKLSFVYETMMIDTANITKLWNKTPTITGNTVTWN